MAEKKKQHIVPACYLKNFIADIPDRQKENSKYESGVYVNNKTLTSGWKLKSVRHNFFTKSYFYTLTEDDYKKPIIENYLSKIENSYPKYFDEINDRKLNNENMSFMSSFVILQLMRSEPSLNQNQDLWDQIANYMDAFEGKELNKELFKEFAKKQLINSNFGHLIYDQSAIVYNSTNFPFITSDNPVVRRQINFTDAKEIIPTKYLKNTESNGKEFPFFFFPLSPHLAYISCNLLSTVDKIIYYSNNDNGDLRNIFYLNYYSIINSYENVYSSVMEPIKGEIELSKILIRNMEKHFILVKIYSRDQRIVSPCFIIDNSNFVINLEIKDLEQLKLIKENDHIEFIEVIEDGKSIRGMRDCKASRIDHLSGRVTIEAKLKLPL
ncbi:hypothetical protein LA02_1625 [Francisella philomiragia]|uniref:DUF4238 domain-containing protein n=1 Tax=Francisella philomiragia TaxID=28110 RepID=UPI0005A573A9|nr:DUF4238 domain-containing protein [Francisella philomiragia]AJI56607.1 hypothetical protein LA02_1625 [Francisella philomiragia]